MRDLDRLNDLDDFQTIAQQGCRAVITFRTTLLISEKLLNLET